MAFSNRWVLADGTLNDEPITIRYRDELDAELEKVKEILKENIFWRALN